MSLNEYMWIYGLAEALALTLIVAIVLGVKWWRLRREHRRWRRARARIDGLIEGAIEGARAKQTDRPELRDSRIASLRALSDPFKQDPIVEEEAWRQALGAIDRCFEALGETTASLAAANHRKAVPTHDTSSPESGQAPEDDGLASPGMESDVEALLEQYRLGRSTISSNREAGGDLKQKYRDLLVVNQSLRSRIDNLAPTDETDSLREELDAFLRSNLAFMRAALTAERNFNLLEQQFDEFEGRIDNLQATINTYRKAVHKLVSERDQLDEEQHQYLIQLDLKDKVIARLNRNYEALRREYAKIYGGTR
ncbi:hypothetical protein [Thiocystis violacea]|uniref:hypothetical protein n=1 Tax=Thiocystis violacea TaxID=13725 RepID=UPI001908232E|nr:hypothetical protein [Thiocystis violacea]MBK1717938.1 hypothetical protein [Thiocystis violacea]